MVEKETLRKQLLGRLLALTKQEIDKRSFKIASLLKNLAVYKQAKTVMFFYPLKGEADLRQVIREDLGKKNICFPVVNLKTGELIPYKVKNLDNDLKQGPYGIKEPDATLTTEVAVSELDAVIVPGLAFDHSGNRLGRGGGFYDRFLSRLPAHTATIGVAFDFQLLENLPFHRVHDQKVKYLVVEEFALKF